MQHLRWGPTVGSLSTILKTPTLRILPAIGLALTVSLCRADQLDEYARHYMADAHIPAVVLGVFKGGSVVMSRAYGFSNLESRTRATRDNVFEIGSVSKQFTATVALMLMQEGKLRLDDPISMYVDKLPAPWRTVTIRQLLNHTSGVPDIENIFGYDSYRNIYTTQQIIEVANSKPMDFKPGEGWSYSNTGYYLLGLCLERVTGKPYAQVMKERIFDPLGMTHTGESNPTQVISNRSSGYQVTDEGVLENRDAMQPSACKGAGTLVSTLADMAKWDEAITKNRFLKPEVQQMMWTSTHIPKGDVGYGFGWFISPWKGHASVEHSGGTAGFSCDYRRFQDLGFSVMVFTNLYATSPGGIPIRAADMISPGLSYMSAKSIPEAVPGRRRFLLDAMAVVAKDGERPPTITETMWKSCAKISHQVWKQRLAHLDKFELIDDQKYSARKSPLGEDVVETCTYRLVTGRDTTFIVFELTPDGRIAIQSRQDN